MHAQRTASSMVRYLNTRVPTAAPCCCLLAGAKTPAAKAKATPGGKSTPAGGKSTGKGKGKKHDSEEETEESDEYVSEGDDDGDWSGDE